jgi:hypothetical protein
MEAGIYDKWGRKICPRCKQQLDEVRTLAIKLFEAGEAQKRNQPKHIWGQTRTWEDLPSESVAVWDAVAICAYQQLKRQQSSPGTPRQ